MVTGMNKRRMVKAMKQAGAYLHRQGAEHEIWHCACGEHQTQLPRHGALTPGVVRSVTKDMACHTEGWLK